LVPRFPAAVIRLSCDDIRRPRKSEHRIHLVTQDRCARRTRRTRGRRGSRAQT
jgi:hypothetical protein